MTKLTFKKIDFFFQISLILSYIISSLLGNFYLVIIFPIGFWQIFSAIINFYKFKIQTQGRKKWFIMSVWLFIFILTWLFLIFTGIIKSISFIPLLGLSTLFFLLILEIWYLIITWQELKEMEKIALGK